MYLWYEKNEYINWSNLFKFTAYYEKYNPIYTKPKVITESNYEATQIQGSPHNDLVEIKPENPFVTQIKAPLPAAPIPHREVALEEEERVVEIKPLNPYVAHQIKVPAPQDELLEIKPINTYSSKIKTPVAISQDEVVEIKPQSPYINQIKTTQAPATQVPIDIGHTNEDKKIVEYYIPIIQDIDDEKVVYEPSK